MQIRKYRMGDAVNMAAQSLGATFYLTKGENAIRILPADTKFALVADVVEKDFNESFVEADVNIATGSFTIGNAGGAVGRFFGYLAVTDTKLRFYKAVDQDVTQRPDNQTNVVGQVETPSLVYETDISKLSLIQSANKYVLTDGVKKFLIDTVWPISDTGGKFESKAIGTRNGLDQLFDFINSHGGSLKPSNTGNIITLTVFVVIIAIFIYFFFANKI
jgi:hypothetical protein